MGNMKVITVGLFAVATTCVLFADEFTLVEGFTDWNDVHSYKTMSGGTPSALPGTTSGVDDTVYIPENMLDVYIDDDSIETVSRFKYLRTEKTSRDTRIVIDVKQDHNFDCYFNDSFTVTAHLVKKGSGTLRLGDVGPSHVEYNTEMTIEEGMLMMPQNLASWTHLYVGQVTVESNGCIFLSSPGNFRCEALYGSGLVTNDVTKSTTQLQPQSVKYLATFSGQLVGKYNFGGNVTQYLTGTNNTFSGSVTISGSFYGNKASTLGVAKLGNKSNASSIGKNDKIVFGEGSTAGSTGGGRLVYLGDGSEERSNKDVEFTDTGYCPVVLDAGSHGGLVMEGAWKMTSAKMIQLVLDGSNTEHECAFVGAFSGKSQDDVDYTARITKKGPGIWRLGDNPGRNNSGVIAVEEGTLRFDSISEKGQVCSLGLSTELYDDVSGPKPVESVPYAFLLGCGATEGTLEYTGATSGSCATRPIAVKGRGRIKATGAALSLSGVSAAAQGGNTLTLDGVAVGNVLRDVSDGVQGSTLAIAKEGTGTWTLAGDLTFSGGIAVNEGTLVVRKCASEPHKWFRLTIKETARYSGRYTWTNPTWDDRTLRLWAFYMYDAAGNVRSSGLTYNDAPLALGADQVAYGFDTRPNPQSADQGPAAMFHEAWQPMRLNFSYSLCVLTQPSTHVPFLIRLADSKPEIAAINMAMDLAANADYCCGEPTAYSFEGSVDGVTWTLLTEDDAVNLPTVSKGKVYSPNRTFDRHPARTVADQSFASPIAVSLGANATLRGEYAGGATPITISSLTINAAGGSVCEGFTFETTGTLDVSNVTTAYKSGSLISVAFPVDSGWENLKNWTVTVNGHPIGSKYSVSVAQDGIRVFKPGFVMLVR